MILDCVAYTVMADVYVRVRLLPSVGEGGPETAWTVVEETYTDGGAIDENERLVLCARRALKRGLTRLLDEASEAPF